MNLKKTVLSLFAATAILGSMVTPVALAQNDTGAPTTDRKYSMSAEEGGSLTAASITSKVTFAVTEVTNTTGGTVTRPGSIQLTDSRAESPGWIVQVTAGNMTGANNPNAFIESKNLFIQKRTSPNHHGWSQNCSARVHSGTPVNPSNPYQKPVWVVAESPQPLDQAVSVISADRGRGCGIVDGNVTFTLDVPAGQQPDTYSGNITVTTLPAEPAAPAQ